MQQIRLIAAGVQHCHPQVRQSPLDDSLFAPDAKPSVLNSQAVELSWFATCVVSDASRLASNVFMRALSVHGNLVSLLATYDQAPLLCLQALAVTEDGQLFAYASSLAVYIFERQPCQLCKIISRFDRQIVALAFSPYDPNLLAIATLDQVLMVGCQLREPAVQQSFFHCTCLLAQLLLGQPVPAQPRSCQWSRGPDHIQALQSGRCWAAQLHPQTAAGACCMHRL